MDYEDDFIELFQNFLDDLIEMYRNEAMQTEEGRELWNTQKELSRKVMDTLSNHSGLSVVVNKYISAINDVHIYEQESLYIHGIMDGIKIMKEIGTL